MLLLFTDSSSSTPAPSASLSASLTSGTSIVLTGGASYGYTLADILQDAGAYTDLDSTLPTSTELNTRTRFANMAVREWGKAYTWRQLKTEAQATMDGYDSIFLPNFVRLSSPVREQLNDGTYRDYPEIQPQERFEKNSDDDYCYILGNDNIGFSLYINGYDSNPTFHFSYLRNPSGMATLTDVCEVPDPQFVTDRVISYVLQARTDERFPVVLANGNRLLRNMVSREMVQLPGGVNSTPKRGVAAYSIGG